MTSQSSARPCPRFLLLESAVTKVTQCTQHTRTLSGLAGPPVPLHNTTGCTFIQFDAVYLLLHAFKMWRHHIISQTKEAPRPRGGGDMWRETRGRNESEWWDGSGYVFCMRAVTGCVQVFFFLPGFLQDNPPFRHIIQRGVHRNSLVHHMKTKKKKKMRS